MEAIRVTKMLPKRRSCILLRYCLKGDLVCVDTFQRQAMGYGQEAIQLAKILPKGDLIWLNAYDQFTKILPIRRSCMRESL